MIKASALRAIDDNETSFSTNNAPWLAIHNQNMVIESEVDLNYIPAAVQRLALKMLENDALIKDILNELRIIYTSKRSDFHISLSGKSKVEQKLIIELFQNMYGIISALYYSQETEMLNGRIVFSSKAQMFMTGQYLEIAIQARTKEIVQELSVKYRKHYSIHKNVRVATKDGKLKNELDLVIEFGDILYVIEIKSGKNFRDFEKYMTIGRKYKIVPDRFLLVDNYLSDDHAKTIEYFCEYYVSNLENDSFESKLSYMIEKDQNGGD